MHCKRVSTFQIQVVENKEYNVNDAYCLVSGICIFVNLYKLYLGLAEFNVYFLLILMAKFSIYF